MGKLQLLRGSRGEVSFAKTEFKALFGASMLTTSVEFLMLLADTIVAGNVLGESAIAGVNIVTPVYAAGNFVACAITMGTFYLFCRALGEFKQKRAHQLFGQSVILSVALGVVMFVLMLLGKDLFLDYMNISEAVRAEAEGYWKYEKFVILVLPVNYLMSQMVFADGDDRLNLWSNVAMIIGNIVLSIFLAMKFGSEGISLGTLIGTVASTLVLCQHFFKKTNELKFEWYLSWKDIAEMCKLAMTDSVSYLCWGVLTMVLNKIMIEQFGDAYLPILTMALGVYEMGLLFDGIGAALSPVAEVYLGEKNYANERMLADYSLKVCIIEGAVVLAALLLLAPLIPWMYGIRSAELVPLCITAVRILAVSMPFSGIAYLVSSQYLLVRHIFLSVLYAIAHLFFFNAAFALILVNLMGMDGIWWSFVFGSVACIAAFGAYVRMVYGKDKFPWLVDMNEDPIFNRSFVLSEEELMKVRDEAEEFLAANGVERRTMFKVMLLLEECGVTTLSENAGQKVIAEYTLVVENDKIAITMRDTGKIFDLTDTDAKITDFCSYVVSNIMNEYKDRQYLTTISFNRNALSVPRDKRTGEEIKEQGI